MAAAQDVDRRGMFDKLIGPTDANYRGSEVLFAEELENSAAIAAGQNVIFQSDDDVGGTTKEFSGAGVNRLKKARIDDGAVEPFFREFLGSITRQLLHIAERKETDFPPAILRVVRDHLRLSDFQHLR